MQLFFISSIGLLKLVCQHLVLVFDIVDNERLFLDDGKLLPQMLYLYLFLCQLVSLAGPDEGIIVGKWLLLALLLIVNNRFCVICLRSRCLGLAGLMGD